MDLEPKFHLLPSNERGLDATSLMETDVQDEVVSSRDSRPNTISLYGP